MGPKMAGRWRPLSKVINFLHHLILLAAVVLCSQYPLTDLTTHVFSQSILCSFLDIYTAIPFLLLLLTTAHLYFIIWTFNVRLDPPVYTPSQSLQGTWYTIVYASSSLIAMSLYQILSLFISQHIHVKTQSRSSPNTHTHTQSMSMDETPYRYIATTVTE